MKLKLIQFHSLFVCFPIGVLILVVHIFAGSAGAAMVKGNPMVHRKGRFIVDGGGRRLYLRTVNLGGWLHWEGWIFGGPIFFSESQMLSRIAEVVGEDECRKFYQSMHDNFITDSDIAAIAGMGFNSVRVPINHRLLEDDSAPYKYKEAGWRTLDRLVASCAKHRLYVIFDLHSPPGGQEGRKHFYRLFDTDPKHLIWNDEQSRRRTIAFWKAIARRYGENRTIAGYDLINEPAAPSPAHLVNLYKDIVAGIREVDADHMVIIEGARSATDFTGLDHPLEGNEALSFHMYTWFGDNRRRELRRYRQLIKRSGLPLWNGECGQNSLRMDATTVALFEKPDYQLSGWAFWTYKRLPASKHPSLVAIGDSPRWSKFMRWLCGRSKRKPARDEALAAMNEIKVASRFENCIVDRSLVRRLLVDGRSE